MFDHPGGPRTEPRTCSLCGRQGNANFTLVDRYADGSEEWRCKASNSCRGRAKRHELQALAGADSQTGAPARHDAQTVPSSKIWIGDADEGVWHTLDIVGDALYRSACGWEVDGRTGVRWPHGSHEPPPAGEKHCDECVAREMESITAGTRV